MNNKDKIVQEQRTIEAMKKGYMGYEGKFAFIARKMGDAIISQGSNNFTQNFMEDFYELDEKPDMPIMDEDEVINEVGICYEDLKSGNNFSILLLYANNEIIVRHEGKLVYKETANELEGFVPNDTWEKLTEKLYEKAKIIEKNRRPRENEKIEQLANKRKKEILDKLKDKWGV